MPFLLISPGLQTYQQSIYNGCMAIEPLCDSCGQSLDDFGAILLSPPQDKTVSKFHICKPCYQKFEKHLLINKNEAKITTDMPKR